MQPIMFQILFIMSGKFYQYFQYKNKSKETPAVILLYVKYDQIYVSHCRLDKIQEKLE